MAFSALLTLAFCLLFLIGLFYFGFWGEGPWRCWASQDDNITTPWDITQGPAPDDYH